MQQNVHDYVPESLASAAQLARIKLSRVVRLRGVPSDGEVEMRMEYGPALLEGGGRRWLMDVDESQSNILVTDVTGGIRGEWYSGFTLQEAIADEEREDCMSFLLRERIALVEVISREPYPDLPESFSMCGIRLTMESRKRVCIGTCLVERSIHEVAFLLPEEVDPDLRYSPLRPEKAEGA